MDHIICTACGSKELEPANFSFHDIDDSSMPIAIYVCKKCGHLELYKTKDTPQPHCGGDGKACY